MASPSSSRGAAAPAACPSCGHAPLDPVALRDLTVDQCSRCRGVWFDRGELDVHLHAATAAPEAVPGPAPTAAPARRGGPAFRPCPRCGALMTPRVWERHSGVVVDTCTADGVWLDGAELDALEGWVRSPRARRKAAEADAAATAATTPRSIESFGTDRSARSMTATGPGLAEAVGEILWEIVDFFW